MHEIGEFDAARIWHPKTQRRLAAFGEPSGALMGIGGVTAMGCTVGQGLSGVSTLSLGSMVALAGILAGAWGGVRFQAWRVERMS